MTVRATLGYVKGHTQTPLPALVKWRAILASDPAKETDAGRCPDSATERPRALSQAARWDHPPSAISPLCLWAVVGLAFVLGSVLRVWVLGSPLGDVDLDEATVGLQARGFLDGSPAVFFPGQSPG